jgi:S1-C subfamily serine protease
MNLDTLTPEVARQLRLDDNVRGAVITSVDPESAAERYGLNRGDVIVRVGGTRITTAADAQRELARVPSGGTALMRIVRRGQDGPDEIFVTPKKD